MDRKAEARKERRHGKGRKKEREVRIEGRQKWR